MALTAGIRPSNLESPQTQAAFAPGGQNIGEGLAQIFAHPDYDAILAHEEAKKAQNAAFLKGVTQRAGAIEASPHRITVKDNQGRPIELPSHYEELNAAYTEPLNRHVSMVENKIRSKPGYADALAAAHAGGVTRQQNKYISPELYREAQNDLMTTQQHTQNYARGAMEGKVMKDMLQKEYEQYEKGEISLDQLENVRQQAMQRAGGQPTQAPVQQTQPQPLQMQGAAPVNQLQAAPQQQSPNAPPMGAIPPVPYGSQPGAILPTQPSFGQPYQRRMMGGLATSGVITPKDYTPSYDKLATQLNAQSQKSDKYTYFGQGASQKTVTDEIPYQDIKTGFKNMVTGLTTPELQSWASDKMFKNRLPSSDKEKAEWADEYIKSGEEFNNLSAKLGAAKGEQYEAIKKQLNDLPDYAKNAAQDLNFFQKKEVTNTYTQPWKPDESSGSGAVFKKVLSYGETAPTIQGIRTPYIRLSGAPDFTGTINMDQGFNADFSTLKGDTKIKNGNIDAFHVVYLDKSGNKAMTPQNADHAVIYKRIIDTGIPKGTTTALSGLSSEAPESGKIYYTPANYQELLDYTQHTTDPRAAAMRDYVRDKVGTTRLTLKQAGDLANMGQQFVHPNEQPTQRAPVTGTYQPNQF